MAMRKESHYVNQICVKVNTAHHARSLRPNGPPPPKGPPNGPPKGPPPPKGPSHPGPGQSGGVGGCCCCRGLGLGEGEGDAGPELASAGAAAGPAAGCALGPAEGPGLAAAGVSPSETDADETAGPSPRAAELCCVKRLCR